MTVRYALQLKVPRWYRAFRRFDTTVPVWRLHRAIGMGGDQLVTAVAGAV